LLIAMAPIANTGICRGMGEYFGRVSHVEDEIVLPNYEPVIWRTMHMVFMVIGVVVLTSLWGVPLWSVAESGVGAQVMSGLISVALTVLIAYVIWQVVKVSIDRKIVLDGGGVAGDGHDTAGEGGGVSAVSRISTLLPLIRSFLLAVIVVVATMIGLSSLGVEIGPLIAGAGIVGIAIGFGAQTLVRDIVSGIFSSGTTRSASENMLSSDL